jgi:hypothetical protein
LGQKKKVGIERSIRKERIDGIEGVGWKDWGRHSLTLILKGDKS